MYLYHKWNPYQHSYLSTVTFALFCSNIRTSVRYEILSIAPLSWAKPVFPPFGLLNQLNIPRNKHKCRLSAKLESCVLAKTYQDSDHLNSEYPLSSPVQDTRALWTGKVNVMKQNVGLWGILATNMPSLAGRLDATQKWHSREVLLSVWLSVMR